MLGKVIILIVFWVLLFLLIGLIKSRYYGYKSFSEWFSQEIMRD